MPRRNKNVPRAKAAWGRWAIAGSNRSPQPEGVPTTCYRPKECNTESGAHPPGGTGHSPLRSRLGTHGSGGGWGNGVVLPPWLLPTPDRRSDEL